MSLESMLIVGAILFCIGLYGSLARRNALAVLMSIELMLNGVALSFIAFSRYWGDLSGQLFVFFLITVAAAEAAVGLAIIIAVFRARDSLNIDDLDSMKY